MSDGRILVAGAGIGGLTAAACLLMRGFDVDVFEQAPALGEIGAGLQVSANAGRVYRYLGLMDEIAAVGVVPDAYRFRLFDSGEVLQTIPLGPGYAERHGVPYVTIHRADLHALLADKVRALKPDAIRLDARATGFSEDADAVTLHLADGCSERGAALIGADGINSAIRAQILGATPATYTGDASWRVTVPTAALPPEFRQASTDIWVGPGRHAVTYPIRRGELINMVGCVEYERPDSESWTTPKPWQEMRNDFVGWHKAITAIIAVADRDRCYRWAMNNRAPVAGWSTRRATLLGDAAHPTLPYMAQGAAMAVEDAAVLARAFEQAPEVAAAIDLYQRNRVERTARIVNESSANRALFHMESVEALRDAFAKRDLNRERNAWLFSYDPVTVELS